MTCLVMSGTRSLLDENSEPFRDPRVLDYSDVVSSYDLLNAVCLAGMRGEQPTYQIEG